ncbi:hypothetical protein KCU90_g137, partial [Aureobasidium melanogenum]
LKAPGTLPLFTPAPALAEKAVSEAHSLEKICDIRTAYLCLWRDTGPGVPALCHSLPCLQQDMICSCPRLPFSYGLPGLS